MRTKKILTNILRYCAKIDVHELPLSASQLQLTAVQVGCSHSGNSVSQLDTLMMICWWKLNFTFASSGTVTFGCDWTNVGELSFSSKTWPGLTYRVGEFQFYRTHRFFVQKGLLVLYSFFLLIRILNSRTCIETGTVLDRGGNPESAALVKEDLRGVVKKTARLTVR